VPQSERVVISNAKFDGPIGVPEDLAADRADPPQVNDRDRQ
jgi:hypothetical protein